MKQIIIPRSQFLEKGFVRAHTRKGKPVASFFTKRQPAKATEKHTRERFYDHDKSSAAKAHAELESKKKEHQVLLQALKEHHKKIKKEGDVHDEEHITHKEKLSHLDQHIKNSEQEIENHSRKQDHIKNRYVIAGKQHERKREKSDLEKKIAPHSDKQKETIRKIHEHGKDTHETGRVLTGKDNDHVYLERRNKETGEKHHVAIHKDGEIKDPNILHEGKFDHKELTDKQAQAEKKKVIIKKPEPKPKIGPKKEVKKPVEEKPIKKEPKKDEKPDKKSVIVKKEEPKKGKLNKNEEKAIDKWVSDDGNKEIVELLKSKKSNKLTKDLDSAIGKLDSFEGTTYRGIGNLSKEDFEKIISSPEMEIPHYTSASYNEKHSENFLRSNMKKGSENYGITFKIASKTAKDLKTYEDEVVLLPSAKYRIKKVGEVKPYTYTTRIPGGGVKKIKDKKAKIVEIEVEEITKTESKKVIVKKPVKSEEKRDPDIPLLESDIEEISKSFRKETGIKRISITGYDFNEKNKLEKTLNYIKKDIKDLYKRHPEFKKAMKGKNRNIKSFIISNTDVINKETGTLGSYQSGNRRLLIAGNYKGVEGIKLNEGNHGVDDSFSGVLRHELGHNFQFQDETLRNEWNRLLTDLKINTAQAGDVRWEGGSTSEFKNIKQDENSRDYWAKNVSLYASSSVWESFAESFSAYTHPDYGKEKRLPKEIEGFMDKHVGKK